MVRIAFVCPPLRGHLDPTLALARRLARRGHAVFLFAGARPDAPSDKDVMVIDMRLPHEVRAIAGSGGVTGTVRAMAARFEALCDLLPGLFTRHAIDLVVADQTEPAGALAAMALGIPHVSLACALPLDREPNLPPPFVDWEHRLDGSRRWLYRGGHRVTDWLMRPLSRAIRRRAGLWGVTDVASLDETFSRRLQIFQLPQALDHPREQPPPNAHWVGPLRDEAAEPVALPAGLQSDSRPLAFCSLGTLQGHRSDLFQAIAGSVARCGLRPVVAHGGLLPAREAALLPGEPLVADFLPQRAMLAQARLAVLHGGLNSVLDALAAGVPMVVTPLAYEQGAIAARVAASGAGLVVKPRRARQDLAPACRRVLEEPAFAAAAARMAEAIAVAGGVGRAAVLIEALMAEATATTPEGRQRSALRPAPFSSR